MHMHRLTTITAIMSSSTFFAAGQGISAGASQGIPRTADGKPDMQGIWQATGSAGADLQNHVASLNMLAGRSEIGRAHV